MAFADQSTYFGTGDSSILGRFNERDTGNLFEFSKNPELVLAPPAHGGRNMEFPHLVWVTTPVPGIDCGYRRARVGKTVVHIITDEIENGRWVVEKWYIKQNSHNLYKNG